MKRNKAFLVLLAVSAVLAGCGSNNAAEPFSPEYIENYLETCYGTDFSYVGEFGPEGSDIEAYTFKDSSGIETVVKKSKSEVVIGADYRITDYYDCAKLAADEEVQKKLDDSGFEYSFKNDDGITCGIYMNVRSYDDIPKASEVLHGIADSYRIDKAGDASAFDEGDFRFGSMSPHIALYDEERRPLSYINIPSVREGEQPYIISLPEFIEANQSAYKSNREYPKAGNSVEIR